jgi:uncharacterized membrane protein
MDTQFNETYKMRLAVSILAAVGFIDSLYLTWIKLSHNQALCIQGVGNCWTVNNSKYADWNGIPIALIGALGYALILVFNILESKTDFFENNGRIIIFGLVLIGFLFSAYLTFIEFAVLHAFCPFCGLSALIMLVLFILSIIRLIKN